MAASGGADLTTPPVPAVTVPNMIWSAHPAEHLLASAKGRLAQLSYDRFVVWDATGWTRLVEAPLQTLGGRRVGALADGSLFALGEGASHFHLVAPGSPTVQTHASVVMMARSGWVVADAADPRRSFWVKGANDSTLVQVSSTPTTSGSIRETHTIDVPFGAMDDVVELGGGRLVSIASATLFQLRLDTGAHTSTTLGGTDQGVRLAKGPADGQLWAGGFEGTVRLLDVANPQAPPGLTLQAPERVYAIDASPTHLAVLSYRQPPIRWTLRVFRVDGTPLWDKSLDHGNQTNDLHVPYESLRVGDGWVAAAGADGRMVVFDLRDGAQRLWIAP